MCGSKRNKVCLTACLFLCLSFRGYTQSIVFPDQLAAAYHKALHYRFHKWPVVDPDTIEVSHLPYAIYINSLAATLSRVITAKDPASDHRDQWERLLNDLDKRDTVVSFVRAETAFHQSLVHFMNRDAFRSFMQFRVAYRRSEDIENLGSPKVSATLKIALGSIPENYQWIFRLLGYEGDPVLGMQELDQQIAAKNDLSLECQLVKLMFQQYLFDESTFGDWLDLRTEYADSPMIQFLFNTIALKNHQSQYVIDLQLDSHIDQVYGQLGEAYLNKLEYDSALYYFDEYEDNLMENATVEMLHKIWLCHTLKGDERKASEYKEKLLNIGSSVTEADANALEHLSIEAPIATELMKVRLTTDGGYYDISKQLLDQLDTSATMSDKTSVELLYRRARLVHLSGNAEAAIPIYKQVLSKSPASGWYFAPNTAYLLGRIYQDKSEFEEALRYLDKVGNYRNYPYKSSLNNKADLYTRLIESSIVSN